MNDNKENVEDKKEGQEEEKGQEEKGQEIEEGQEEEKGQEEKGQEDLENEEEGILLKLGDIILITDPSNEILNNNIFLIEYIDKSKITLINSR